MAHSGRSLTMRCPTCKESKSITQLMKLLNTSSTLIFRLGRVVIFYFCYIYISKYMFEIFYFYFFNHFYSSRSEVLLLLLLLLIIKKPLKLPEILIFH